MEGAVLRPSSASASGGWLVGNASVTYAPLSISHSPIYALCSFATCASPQGNKSFLFYPVILFPLRSLREVGEG